MMGQPLLVVKRLNNVKSYIMHYYFHTVKYAKIFPNFVTKNFARNLEISC